MIMRAVQEIETGRIRAPRGMVHAGPVRLAGAKGRGVAVPEAIVKLFDVILMNAQLGRPVSIVPEHQELTTQRAANLLGVSRPFLVELLEDGAIPYHMAGSHRRVYLKDIQAYKRRRDRGRHRAINRMARMELEAGTYDTVILPEGAEER